MLLRPSSPRRQVLDSFVAVPEHVVYRVLATKTILVNLEHGTYHELNREGGRMLHMLQDIATPHRAAEELAVQRSQPVERIRDELSLLIISLEDAGLVEVDRGAPPRAVRSATRAGAAMLLPIEKQQLDWSNKLERLGRLQSIRLAIEVLTIYVSVRIRFVRKHFNLLNEVAHLRPDIACDFTAERANSLAIRLGKAVTSTLALLPTKTTCLLRSLVLLRMLSRRGLGACLVIAVDHESEPFAAHAWVECGRLPLLDPGEPRLARLVQIDTVGSY